MSEEAIQFSHLENLFKGKYGLGGPVLNPEVRYIPYRDGHDWWVAVAYPFPGKGETHGPFMPFQVQPFIEEHKAARERELEQIRWRSRPLDVLDQVLKDLHHQWGRGEKVYAIAMHPDDLEAIVSERKNEAWWVIIPCDPTRDPSITAICGIRVITSDEVFRGSPRYKLTPLEAEKP